MSTEYSQSSNLSHFDPHAYLDNTRWTLQIVDALSYVHTHGVIHGDIGVHNIMITYDKQLKLIDFGGSRLDGSKCLCFPSARYRRLPSWLEEDYEPEIKDDIFALGMVLYEINTGHKAYSGLEMREVLSQIAGKNFPEISQVRELQLRIAIERCWECQYDIAADILITLDPLAEETKVCGAGY